MSKYIPGARALHNNQSIPAALEQSGSASLPSGGLSRFRQIQPYLPVSRETWRLLVIAQRAPQPFRLSERCTVWRNDDVSAWLANPAAFTVEG